MAILTTINLDSLDGINGFSLDEEGELVSNAGDINGDGFDDVIVGSTGSHVVFGKASGFSSTLALSSLDGNNGFHLVGMTSGSVSNAGDINGDGFDDVIIGTDNYSYDINRDGFAGFVVFGKASGFDASVDLLSLDGNNGFSLNGLSPSSSLFSIVYAVSSAGDVNGDGFDDVIIGGVGIYGGVSYVVFGKAAGFGAGISLRSLNGSDGFRLVAGYDFTAGFSVSSAGDVNGDGFDDVIIGAPVLYERYGDNEFGSSYVVFGKASGFDATLDLHSLDGSNGFRLNGAANDWSGFVSNAGDVNGDGFDDLIIVAPKDQSSDGPSGSAYVVFGKASNFSATMDLSSIDGSNGFRLDGVETGRFPSQVSNAGDVNGDGFDDLIIGSDEADPNGDDSGSSYVVFGKASGFSATINLSNLDNNAGVRLDGVAAFDHSGASVSGAGDVNGDGFDDLIVGTHTAYPSRATSYVVFGSSNFSGIVTFVGTPEEDILTGTSADERFEGSDGNDTLIGGGGADVFQGGNGDDVIRLPDLDFQTLEGGAGTDTLELTEGGINLDLAEFHDKINGTETIDLTGSGDNTLTFTLPDLFSLSDTNIFTVDGDAGDRVVGIGPGWADGGIDGDYHIYTNRGTVVRVAVAVSTDSPPPGVISLSSLNGSNGFRLDGVMAYENSGSSVSNAGDVNGDGFDDLIIGAPYAYPNGDRSGASYVVFGKAAGFDAPMDLANLDGSNGFRLDGVAAYDRSGKSLSSAGDVNGDGFADVIIDAPGASPNDSRFGTSYVVFGKASGFSAAMNLSSLDGSNGFRLDGVAQRNYLGSSVSNAGDVNGDGFADLLVGDPYVDPNGTFSGSSYVVFGKAAGFHATLDLTSLNGSNGFRLDGVAEYDNSGSSVSNAGDVNGDGFADVIIGALGASSNGSRSGASYVVFGKASGFDTTMNLASLDGSSGFRLDGVTTYDFSGSSVSNAGDVNGDGFDDVIIGAFGADPNGSYSGTSYVVFGKATGFDATMNLSSLDGSNGFRLDGDRVPGSSTYELSVSNAGDFNGDGFGDLIVGSAGTLRYSDVNYVVFGKAPGFDAAMSLSTLDGNNGFRLDGVAKSEYSDISVSSAGDVNGDGFDDVIIGASGADPNGGRSGSSYVIFGRSSFTDDEVIQGTPGNDKLTGTPLAEVFEAGDGNDRMIGRGGADVFHGEAGDDYIQVTDLGFGSVDGGSGNDVLHTDGKDLNLDLANFGDKIQGIETICLFGRGDNELTLTAADLLNLSDTDNTLRVNGNAGDHITVRDDGWVDEGSRGQGYYHVYTNDEAVLLVGMNVTIDFV